MKGDLCVRLAASRGSERSLVPSVSEAPLRRAADLSRPRFAVNRSFWGHPSKRGIWSVHNLPDHIGRFSSIAQTDGEATHPIVRSADPANVYVHTSLPVAISRTLPARDGSSGDCRTRAVRQPPVSTPSSHLSGEFSSFASGEAFDPEPPEATRFQPKRELSALVRVVDGRRVARVPWFR